MQWKQTTRLVARAARDQSGSYGLGTDLSPSQVLDHIDSQAEYGTVRYNTVSEQSRDRAAVAARLLTALVPQSKYVKKYQTACPQPIITHPPPPRNVT